MRCPSSHRVRAVVAALTLFSLSSLHAAHAQETRTRLVAPEGEVDGHFGASVVLSGDVLFSGSPGATDVTLEDAGAGWVYRSKWQC